MSTNSTPPRPPFDPELEPALAPLRETFVTLSDESLPKLRSLVTDGVPGVEPADLTADGKVVVEDIEVPGPDGQPLSLLVLRPSTGNGPWPAIYHTHGGGMIMGNRRSGVEMFVPYVADSGAVVVSVEYRLAPECPDPGPIEDCYAGLEWTARHAAELQIDPARIMVAGASAGGGLAAGTALMARDKGFPHLTHQVLICPMLDDRMASQSARMLVEEGIWDRNSNTFGWRSLLGDRCGGAEVSHYAAPARAVDLSGLPLTYIDVGSAETFRDEAIDFAQRLSQHGVGVDFHMWAGGFHGFDLMVPHAAVSQASNATRRDFLKRALAR